MKVIFQMARYVCALSEWVRSLCVVGFYVTLCKSHNKWDETEAATEEEEENAWQVGIKH